MAIRGDKSRFDKLDKLLDGAISKDDIARQKVEYDTLVSEKNRELEDIQKKKDILSEDIKVEYKKHVDEVEKGRDKIAQDKKAIEDKMREIDKRLNDIKKLQIDLETRAQQENLKQHQKSEALRNLEESLLLDKKQVDRAQRENDSQKIFIEDWREEMEGRGLKLEAKSRELALKEEALITLGSELKQRSEMLDFKKREQEIAFTNCQKLVALSENEIGKCEQKEEGLIAREKSVGEAQSILAKGQRQLSEDIETVKDTELRLKAREIDVKQKGEYIESEQQNLRVLIKEAKKVRDAALQS